MKRHASTLVVASIALSLFNACDSVSEAYHLEQPFLPIQLRSDSTVVPLDDFLGNAVAIDSAFYGRTKLPVQPAVNSTNGHVTLKEKPFGGLGILTIWSSGDHWEIPVFPSKMETVTFRLDGSEQAETVFLKGAMNGWSTTATPLEFDGSGWTCQFTLPRGKHAYQLIIDGQEQADPTNPSRIPNGFGAFNSILHVGNEQSNLPISVQKSGSKDRTARLELTTAPGALVSGFWDSKGFTFLQADSSGRVSIGIPAIAFGKERSHIQLWSHTANQRSQEVFIPLHYGAPIMNAETLTRQDRHAMVMYFLMVDRFANGNQENDVLTDDPGIHPRAQYHGGDFAGIREHLSYLDSLGTNTVWVSPIAPNPMDAWGFWTDPSTDLTSKFSAYHGYWPIQSSGTDARFGSMDEFNGLVDDIHSHDMNILVDYVANHVHQDHPVYQQHPDWVTPLYLPDGTMNTQLWDDQRLTTWFDTFMPTLDLERPEVVDMMTDSAMWWVQHSEIDGFRHDATKHIPEIFWRELTAKMKNHGNDGAHTPLFQIGETYGSPELIAQYVSTGMLDAQFDFNLYDALVASLSNPQESMADLIDVANQSLQVYGAHHLMGNITGNQDRPRFASLADGSLIPGEDTKLAGWTRNIQHQGSEGYDRMGYLMAFLMGTPGIPCIYYGDEIADVGGNDPDNRRMMRFDGWNEAEKTSWQNTSDWIHLRRSRMSLLYGQTVYSETEPGVLEINRNYLGEETVVIINTTSQPVNIPKAQHRFEVILGKADIGLNFIEIPAYSTAAVGTAASI
ncbi:MAG: alpha-amylase family glycosyl hydrolase [Bacteroidetes bacterium]|jgi:cyclomaltodextrinase / maltogenic alpha-amylase / neopullulanase|nr:alpha-amylase family glycosyl hydrolase [Bacteroidota bacterium]